MKNWKDVFPKENRYFETENGILYKGNSLDIIKSFPKDSINLIVTSPPYNKGYWSSNRNINNGFKTKSRRIDYGEFDDNLEPKDYENWQRNILWECVRVIKKDGSIFYNHIDILKNHQTIHPLFIYDFPLKQIIIWNRKNTPKLDKSYFLPVNEYIFWLQKDKNARTKFYRKELDYKTNVWEFQPSREENHPAPFPEELPLNCIKATTDKQNIVLDPFVGSGTTIRVAEREGRKWIGIEISGEYCEYIKQSIINPSTRVYKNKEALFLF